MKYIISLGNIKFVHVVGNIKITKNINSISFNCLMYVSYLGRVIIAPSENVSESEGNKYNASSKHFRWDPFLNWRFCFSNESSQFLQLGSMGCCEPSHIDISKLRPWQFCLLKPSKKLEITDFFEVVHRAGFCFPC